LLDPVPGEHSGSDMVERMRISFYSHFISPSVTKRKKCLISNELFLRREDLFG
jgi:hypothetical protein